jgi:hypothetical protein
MPMQNQSGGDAAFAVAPERSPAENVPSRRGRHAVLVRIALALAIFSLAEGLIFHSRFYPGLLEPQSSAGSLIAILRIEQERHLANPNQVLAVGDSRMGLRARVTDKLVGETGYTFANINTDGTFPRCWPYMLREVDPERNRYSAILVPTNEYEDDDWGDFSAIDVDIHYLAPLLRLSDAFDFARSFPTWRLRGKAFESVFLKGLVYKADFADLLRNSHDRLKRIGWTRAELARARYNFPGSDATMTGLEVDWDAHRIIQYPPGRTPEQRLLMEQRLLRPSAPYTGARTRYRKLWYGRIVDYYRGTRTRVIFFRLPRGPVVRPYPMSTSASVVRDLGAQGRAIVLDEHLLDSLERPELFMDEIHLNGVGCELFSAMLAREVGRALGRPPAMTR